MGNYIHCLHIGDKSGETNEELVVDSMYLRGLKSAYVSTALVKARTLTKEIERNKERGRKTIQQTIADLVQIRGDGLLLSAEPHVTGYGDTVLTGHDHKARPVVLHN